MNQIQYLIKAVLLLLFLILGIAFISFLSNIQLIDQRSPVVDFESKPLPPSKIYSNGQMIFQQNCSSCHSLFKVVQGPALAGLEERGPWKDRANVVKWIHNPAAFIRINPYTSFLQKEYGQIMPSFPQLSKDEIYELLDYIKSQNENPLPIAVY